MFANLAVDALVGLVPFAGDVYDFFFRAHRRNLDLLEARLADGQGRGRPIDWLVLGGAALLFLAALAAPIALLVFAIRRVGW